MYGAVIINFSYNSFLFFLRVFESLSSFIGHFSFKITAETTTGPARAPLPTSSTYNIV